MKSARVARWVAGILWGMGLIAGAQAPGDVQGELFTAAEKGDVARIRELMAAGADPHACNQYGESPFGRAARLGQEAASLLMLEQGGAIEGPGGQGCPTPLMMAGMADSTNLMVRLMARGADINAKRFGGRTPLILAAQNGRLEAVRLLLERGADMTPRVGLGELNAVQWAMYANHLDTVELLLDHGADPGLTPLMGPACQGHVELMDLLVSRGAEVNARRRAASSTRDREEQEAAIHVAIECCQEAALAWLLDRGAPVNDPGAQQRTPLITAISASACSPEAKARMCRVLIERGADVNAADRLGITPLMRAAIAGDAEVMELLVAYGADVGAVTPSGLSALDYAAEWDQSHLAERLVKAGSRAGPETLMRAAAESTAAMDGGAALQAVLSGGVEINATNAAGVTALMVAVRKGRRDNAQWLLRHGADPNLQTREDRKSALMMAAEGNDVEMGRLLLEHGADPALRDSHGKTAEETSPSNEMRALIRDFSPKER